jgi:hypothetical protein
VTLDELIEIGDLDELVREVDRLCSRRSWQELVRLRDLSRAAVSRGRQLWPAASLAEYRLALEAPGRFAATAIAQQAGRFALGPLAEVAASAHTWSQLAPYLPAGDPTAAAIAHERVVRGEDLTDDARVPAGVFDPLPLRLQPWEPVYPVATYWPDRLDAPMPTLPPTAPVERGPGEELPAPLIDPDPGADPGASALAQLADAWVTGSNGRASAVAVAGSATRAIVALGVPTESLRIATLTAGEALALMAWTAASGGAHARRRGMAAGRFDAWWAAAAVAGLDDDWSAGDLGEALDELRWYLWDAGEPDTGWWLRLAVDDPAEGLAWAVTATDAA